MIGQTVSHYKILEKIGGGGMGVVYKAEDTKLHRTVALKFLPQALSFDEEAKKRFVQEAEAASSLQHHNICTIHDIDETEDGQIFICMDRYEGETLKKKMEQGFLKIDEAIEILAQIATGLQKAHEKNIIHRDIKPANIFITKDNVVKVLDFGLAKLSGQSMLTKTGSTLGTLAYMSPEQLKSSEVDSRADIFSLGIVFYEMLTGKLPFKGDYESALMYSIVNDEPEPLEKHIPDVSSELTHIVSRALEKSPEDRYRTMDDLLIDLKRFKRDTSKVSVPVVKQNKKTKFKTKHIALIVASIITLAVLVVVFILPSSGKMPRLNPDAKIRTVPLPLKDVSYCTLSADGNWIAFGGADERGKWDVYFMNSSGGEVRRITQDSSDRVNVTHISHDGSWILYSRNHLDKSEIAIVPTLGGTTRIVCEGGDPRFDEANQRIYYSEDAIRLWSINLDGTNDSMVYVDTSLIDFSFGTFVSFSTSPDGKSIAWAKTNRDYSQNIITYDFIEGQEAIIPFGNGKLGELFWTDNNFIIYSQYTKNSGNYDLWIGTPNRGESLQLTKSSTVNELYGVLSEDGKKLLYYQTQRSGNINVMNLETGTITKITSDDRAKFDASLSPDNRYVTSTPDVGDLVGIEIIDRNGEHSIKNIANDEKVFRKMWSPDGKWIAYISWSKIIGGNDQIRIVSPFGSNSSQLIAETKNCFDLQWLSQDTLAWYADGKNWISSIENPSPQLLYDCYNFIYSIQNGKYVLYRNYEKGRQGWWIDAKPTSFKIGEHGTERKILENVDAAIATNGQFMLYISTEGNLIKVLLPNGKEKVLPFKIPKGSNENYPELSISQDGKSVVFIESVSNSKLILWEDPLIWD